MKSIFKVLSLAAALTVSAVAAHADSVNGMISITGYDKYTNDSISFQGNGYTRAEATSGTLSSLFAAGDTSAASVTMNDFSFGAGFVNPTQVFTVTNNGTTVTLTLTSITSSGIDAYGNLSIMGKGVLSETGYDSTVGDFALTSQFGSTGATVTFSASAVAPTPEPNTLMLLGTGLVSSAGMLYRRRKQA